MAAPISSESELSESNEIPDYLDPMSPRFDPQKALYSSYIPYSAQGSVQYNNLNEFVNVLEGKDSKTLKKHKAEQNAQRSQGKDRLSAKASEEERKAAILAKYGGPSERSEAQLKKRRPARNVFTRMEAYDVGPMSLLRRCVQERLRVIVVIRAAVAVRSRCRGYLIAFDKHFNLALMDVDEKFIRPVFKNKKSKNRSAASNNTKQSTRGEISQSSEDSCGLSGVTRQLSIDSECRTRNRHTVPSSHNSDHSSSSSRKTQTSVVRSKIRQEKFYEDESSAHKQKSYKSDSDIRTQCHSGNVKLETDIALSDSESSKGHQSKGKVKEKLKNKYVPFWPLYKKWTEERCYSEYEIDDRHVNQLFVRGDNVVSVSIADC